MIKPLYRFISVDGRYGIALPAHSVRAMLAHAHASGRRETGGILTGCYNELHDTAIVVHADGPPHDSQASRTRFQRGVQGLADLLDRMWKRPIRTYYLGEWHFHPFSSAERSSVDDDTMWDPELRDSFRCPIPVLVILGGDPEGEWSLRAWAYPNRHEPISLLEQKIDG